MSGQRVVTGLRRDGEEFPIDASISQVRDGDARFYTVILRDITERLLADDELRRSKAELQELGVYGARRARAREEPHLARAARRAGPVAHHAADGRRPGAATRRGEAQPEIAARLERMQSLLKSTVAATRRIAADLRPLMLDDLGIVPAVEWLVENFTQRTGVPCDLSIGVADLTLDSARSSAVYRIVQESLTNIAKHAQASAADVAIRRDGDGLLVRVHDDGAGFVPGDPRKPMAFGLRRAARARRDAGRRGGDPLGRRAGDHDRGEAAAAPRKRA